MRSSRELTSDYLKLVDEVDRIVHIYKNLSYNRQQFIEVSIREKIEAIRFLPHRKIQRVGKAKTQPSS